MAFALTMERPDIELNWANWVANHKLETSYVAYQTDYYLCLHACVEEN